ncbi:hypothetical protein PENTCL1PPCAC_9814 [Pristionchus entomophagus]|uniref:Uncharacterized protein n=1 Tax=Pristionchus entomophagus TaxID=358040 RepID=A0AAV5T534_9BILA|nr:hypothetical protein PENTCL1PPCAC_9814 [Pristionchus entomophagus]
MRMLLRANSRFIDLTCTSNRIKFRVLPSRTLPPLPLGSPPQHSINMMNRLPKKKMSYAISTIERLQKLQFNVSLLMRKRKPI